MNRHVSSIGILVVFSFTVALAQTRLRLDECIQAALHNNAALKASAARVDLAEARAGESSTALLPQLKFTGRAARLSSVEAMVLTLPIPGVKPMTLFPSIDHSYLARVTVQQPIFMGYRLQKNVEMAESNAAASREDFSKERADLVLSVSTAYWNLYRAIKSEEVIAQVADQMSEHLRDIQNFAKQGIATDLDVMKVQVQLGDVQVKHIEAKSAIRLAAMSVNSLIGLPLDEQVVPAEEARVGNGNEQDDLAGNELSALTTRAIQNRAELKGMLLRKDMGEAGVAAARAGWFPQVVLAANYDYANPNQRIIPPKDQFDGTWDVGINVQWNIWDWMATKHQTAAAEASLRQTEAGLVQLRDAVALDVAQNYFKVQETNEKVAVAEFAVKQATETQRITSEKFKRGVATNTELLDAEVALLQARLTRTNAVVDYSLANARLRRAVGEP